MERIIAVFGSSRPREGTPEYEEAWQVGTLLGQEGYTIATGGYRGVMEAVCRGARETGSRTIGYTTAHFDPAPANPWVEEERKVPTYFDRMDALIKDSHGYVVLRGGSGTLAELMITWELIKNGSLPVRPLILLGSEYKDIFGYFSGKLSGELSFQKYMNLLDFAENPREVIRLLQKRFAQLLSVDPSRP